MPEEQIPVASEFKGLQKRIAPHLLPPGYSPDCQNCRPYNGLLGRLGPRKGRVKIAAAAYAASVCGLHAGGSDGPLFVAVDDGSSVTISPETKLFSGGSSYGGPTLTSIYPGFYTTQVIATTTGASPCEKAYTGLAIPVNGATKCIATCPSGDFTNEGALYTYVKFDAGIWQLVNTLVAEPGGCCYGLTVTESPSPVDCTGKTLLTGIKAVGEEMGYSVSIAGTIHVMGVKV